MTTATSPTGPASRAALVGPVVLVTLASTVVAGLLFSLVAALVSGAPAAYGALIGLAMVTVFFGLGTVVLDVVAAIAPQASMLLALLTYTLQVVLVALVYAALSSSGALGTTVDGAWLGGTVIAGTIVWLVTHIIRVVRVRQPIYDLPPSGEKASAR